jgi:hypothetical protein
MGFVNQVDSPILLKQCMNSLQPAKHKLSPVKTSPQANLTKRTRHAFSPITIPGTPEIPVIEESLSDIVSSSSTGPGYAAPNDDDTDDELGDIDLYYKAFNKRRPEPGESNAEAMARHQAIEDDYQHLKERYKIERKTWKTQQKGHDLTPSLFKFSSYGSSVHFRSLSSCLSPLRLSPETTPIIEPMNPSPLTEPILPTTNNVQEVSIYTDFSLYPNPDKLLQPTPVDQFFFLSFLPFFLFC